MGAPCNLREEVRAGLADWRAKHPKPAFEVINPQTGEAFRVWADGRTEGFEKYGATLIINRIPQISAAEALGTAGWCLVPLTTITELENTIEELSEAKDAYMRLAEH